MKGRKEQKEKKQCKGQVSVWQKFSSSDLFNVIPTCPRKARKAQLKGKKVETKRVSFKGLILASGGESETKKDFIVN